ncbi:MAG TPA: alpha/beta hydrolase-fold protein [Ktedonobacteraceae bacterium]|jgi:enterochelin esterase-like enzyme|nr:alpha/beta hydrolase-fold protein [Ktedonobacteraceae bacterium]
MGMIDTSIIQHILKKKWEIAFSSLVVLLVVLVSGFLSTHTAINGTLLTTLVGFGLDPQRANFVTSLLLTILVSLVGATLSRRWMVVMMGGVVFFSVHYLAHFLTTAMLPMRDPGGLLEPLDALALLHTSLMMFALAILASCIGVALGRGLAYTLVRPLMHLLAFLYQQRRTQQMVARQEEVRSLPEMRRENVYRLPRVIRELLQALGFIAVLILALGSVNLFVYAPDVGLHLSPAQADLAGTDHVVSQSTILYDTYRSPEMGGQTRSFVVYLPPSYTTPAAKNRRYPVLYLLHGSPGQETNWLTGGKAAQSEDTLSALGKAPELILIMPDGNGRAGETSEWGNSGDGKQLLESSIVQDLVPYVDRKYRTIADASHRGIGGLSMGGFGAANIGIHHPSTFGFIIALGGYYYASGSIWGENAAYLRANSPADVLLQQKQARYIHYFIGAATRDELYSASLRFVHELKQLHIPSTFEAIKGYHAWNIWQIELYHALQWLNTVMR